MKNYEEMSKDVFNRIDEYEREKKMKRAKITKIAAAVTPVCAAAVVGVGLWKGRVLTPENNPMTSHDAETIVTDTEQAATEKSSTVADTDMVTTEKSVEATVAATVRNTDEEISGTKTSVTVQNVTENSVIEDVVTEVSRNDSAETTEAVIVETEPVTPKTELADNVSINTSEVTSNQPNEEITTTTPIENDNSNSDNDFCNILEVVEVDNVRYVQGYADMSYTPDVCLGSPTEYNGPYTSRLDGIPSLLYTTKEDKDVLIIKLENGGVIHLFKERR